MAHYAFLDKNNVVTEVITGIDENELIEGKSPEQWYGEFRGQTCVRTSYNGNIRKNFAGIGYTYDGSFDAFIPIKPFPSWKLNYQTFQWEPPIPEPSFEEGYIWRWSEINQEWVKVPLDQEYNGDKYNFSKWTTQDWFNLTGFYPKSESTDTY